MTLTSTHTQKQLHRRVGQQAASFHFPWMRLCLAFLVLVAVASRLSYAAPAPQDTGVSTVTDSSLSSSAETPSATPDESESTPTPHSGTNLDPETAPSAAPSVIDASTSVEATATSASATLSSALPPPSTVSDTQPSPHPSQEPQPTTPTPAAPSMAALVTPTLTPANSGTNSTSENVTTNNTDTPAFQARNFTSSSTPAPDAIANSYIIVFKDGNFATTAARLTTEIESANVSPAGTIPLAPSAIVPPSAAAAMVSAVNASAPVDPEVSTSDIRAAEVRVPAGRAPTRFRNGRPVPAFDVNNPPNQITQAYPDLEAMAAVLTPDVARRLEQRSDVAEVVRDAQVKAAGWVVKQDDAPSWGLTRISYRDNEVNDKTDYTYDDTAGQGVVVWVIDTGVNHFDPDFEGRVAEGRAFCTGCYAPVPDPNGHGTAVAALIASKTWGVAKRARIVSIRALNEDGIGRWSDVIAALQWVRSMMLRRQFRSARGHIVNLSIEGPINAVVNRMLRQLENLGATIVVAAGNSAVDACTTSPASATAMLNNMVVVGASTADDQPAYFTNVGTCVDVFGPGDEVVTIGDMAVSGTSFASPHVAGTMALYLSANSRLSTFLLKAVLQRQATRGKVHGAEQSQSPNLLVFNSLQGARLPWWMLRGGRW